MKNSQHTESSDSPVKGGRRTRRVGIVAGTFVAVMGSAVTFAAWTSSGTGSSQDVTAGTAAILSVSPDDATAVAGLKPSESKVSSFKVANQNAYPVKLLTVTVTGFTVTGGSGCTEGNSGVTGVVGGSAVNTIVAGGGIAQTSANFTVTVSMSASSHDGCQSAVFTPNLSVTGESS